MAQGTSTSSLFAAEDFTVAYESFAQANPKAYDFDNATLQRWLIIIVQTIPENFNDYINSSEFVALIELIASRTIISI